MQTPLAGTIGVGGDDHHPYEISAVESGKLRALTDHNGWLGEKRLAPVEDIQFKSADGTELDGFLVKPLDYQQGKRYPTILRIHGGPVYQFSHEFMADWQAYAAHGYAVVAVNPRGSSGRGFDFSRAIYADWGNKDVADVLAGVDQGGGGSPTTVNTVSGGSEGSSLPFTGLDLGILLALGGTAAGAGYVMRRAARNPAQ